MTTQYFRGTLYTYVDFLMQNGKYTPEEADAVNDFLYTVLRLIVAWFKRAAKLIPLVSAIQNGGLPIYRQLTNYRQINPLKLCR